MALLIISVALSALAQTYTVPDVGALGSNSRWSYREAYSINASGQIGGQSAASSRRVTDPAFLYSDGVMTSLGTLGGKYASAHGINTSGQIAGYSTLRDRTYRVFLYTVGRVSRLPRWLVFPSPAGRNVRS